jgi:hypothetical protein
MLELTIINASIMGFRDSVPCILIARLITDRMGYHDQGLASGSSDLFEVSGMSCASGRLGRPVASPNFFFQYRSLAICFIRSRYSWLLR